MTLRAQRLSFGYDGVPVGIGLDLEVAEGEFVAIVGPNACGKSTLLRSMSRLLSPVDGMVVLDGVDIATRPSKVVARRLGLLPQTSIAPDGITVMDLVARGRFPHQSAFRQWSRDDEAAVMAAMQTTGVTDLAGRLVDSLSGGQRQRVWVAMVLAQETDLLLLDEPTTFLDIAHQIELMELLTRLHAGGRTVVTVLHDLNQAARYASRIVALREGAIVAEGAPGDVLTAEVVEKVFDLPCRVIEDPVSGAPLVLPLGSRSGRTR